MALHGTKMMLSGSSNLGSQKGRVLEGGEKNKEHIKQKEGELPRDKNGVPKG